VEEWKDGWRKDWPADEDRPGTGDGRPGVMGLPAVQVPDERERDCG
jgi:hypothetical protein